MELLFSYPLIAYPWSHCRVKTNNTFYIKVQLIILQDCHSFKSRYNSSIYIIIITDITLFKLFKSTLARSTLECVQTGACTPNTEANQGSHSMVGRTLVKVVYDSPVIIVLFDYHISRGNRICLKRRQVFYRTLQMPEKTRL